MNWWQRAQEEGEDDLDIGRIYEEVTNREADKDFEQNVGTDPEGTTRRWDTKGRLHCQWGPAVVEPDGSRR